MSSLISGSGILLATDQVAQKFCIVALEAKGLYYSRYVTPSVLSLY